MPRELLDRALISNEHHLRRMTECLLHYNDARLHPAPGQPTPAQADTRPPEPVDLAELQIRRKQIPGGLTHEHYVTA